MLFLKSTTVTKAPGIYEVDIAAKPPGKTYGVFMATDPDNQPTEVLAALAAVGWFGEVLPEEAHITVRVAPAHPAPIPAGQVEPYRFVLPTTNHVFLPGHRIMVQIQSSWFPLYDRNPQTYVDNIFFAKPSDYQPATQKVFHEGAQASFIELPVVEK